MQAFERETADGFEVPNGYGLTFIPLSIAWIGWNSTLLECACEIQRAGKMRRPYLTVFVGPLHIQSGWLFGRDPGCDAIKEAKNATDAM